jgi:hypothetical protein
MNSSTFPTAKPTFECSYEEFRRLSGEYFRALEDVKSFEELEAAHSCLALHYLGIEWDEADPFTPTNRGVGAPAIMRIATRHYIECELRLEQTEVA